MNYRISLAVTALLATATAAIAQPAANHIGAFTAWNAYVANAPDGKMCYAASQPQDSAYSQPISSRGPAFFMITRAPAKNVMNEASTIIGYPFKANSKVTVDIDGQAFSMFTDGDAAWLENQSQEQAFIDAMKAGRSMKVVGTSGRGTITTDTYSLSGVTAAINAITGECN